VGLGWCLALWLGWRRGVRALLLGSWSRDAPFVRVPSWFVGVVVGGKVVNYYVEREMDNGWVVGWRLDSRVEWLVVGVGVAARMSMVRWSGT
jgi:hypothetical protein